jgi:glycine/D-amino acid oxidase-like deaminating enzyme
MNRRNFLKAAGASAGALAISGSGGLGATGRAQAPASRPAAGNSLKADVAVIGAGVFGGWTALSLREMGLSVVLIDQYGPGNSKSSSGGDVRGMRAGYGDEEHYTRWAIAAMEQWKIREAEFGTKLYFESGVLGVSRGLTPQATASRAVFDKLKFPYEILTRGELTKRWPQVATEDSPDVVGFYQPQGGTLKAHASCVAVASMFEKKGGRFVLAKASLAPGSRGTLQSVTLSSGETVSAGTFVFAAGPWLLTMFPELLDKKLLVAKRGYGMIGLPPGQGRDYSYPNLPNTVAMLPSVDGLGLAVPLGAGNTPVDPDTHDRVPTAEEKADVLARTARWFPALKGQPFINAHVCQLENTVDGNFIIDKHPGFDDVWLAGGGSFHGFKFGPVTGDYVAHRVVGRDKHPELAPIFKIKPRTFADATSRNPVVNDLME